MNAMDGIDRWIDMRSKRDSNTQKTLKRLYYRTNSSFQQKSIVIIAHHTCTVSYNRPKLKKKTIQKKGISIVLVLFVMNYNYPLPSFLPSFYYLPGTIQLCMLCMHRQAGGRL
ncbi:hypothetical protein AA313_de0208947 [Arthrobotrys entomopaga]|nr:hypothetical protein AA313_de0208947 [Arthrobotrys entomopaga]